MRIIWELCADANDPDATLSEFIARLQQLRHAGGDVSSRDEFIADSRQHIDAVVRDLAAPIPIPETCQFDAEWREERLQCIVHLLTHEAWRKRCAPH